MTEYHSVKVKLSDSQLNKLKSPNKKCNWCNLKVSSDMVSTDKTNFPRILLLTNRNVASICMAFANSSSKDIKLSKTQLSKIRQSSGFLGRNLGPLIKFCLPLMKNVLTLLAKSVCWYH